MPTYVGNGAWGTGTGVPLTQPQFDGNTYEFHTRILDLETDPPVANSIASMTVNANGLSFSTTLTGGQVLGPFPLPVAFTRWRGDWAALTLYETLDEFKVDGEGIFLVLRDHTSASTFDAAAVGPAVTAGAFAIGSVYIIATIGTTNFTLIGASSNTVGVEFTATGVGSGTGTATPKTYQQLIGASSNTLLGELSDVDVTGAAANAMLVAVSVGSPATIEWQDRTPTQVTALLDAFIGDTGSPGVGGVKGLVPAPADGDAAANKVLRADGTWGVGSTVAALDDLTDVSTAGAVAGHVLMATGSPVSWISAFLALNDLSDVALVSPAAGDFLRYDGGSPLGWTNEAGSAISDLPAAVLPLDPDGLIEIAEPSGSPVGSPPTEYASRSATIADVVGLVPIIKGTISSAVSFIDFTLPAGFAHFVLYLSDIFFNVSDEFLACCLSFNGGSSFENDPDNYRLLSYGGISLGGGTTAVAAYDVSLMWISDIQDAVAGDASGIVGSLILMPGTAATRPQFHGSMGSYTSSYGTPGAAIFEFSGTINPDGSSPPTFGRANVLRLQPVGNGDSPPTSTNTITRGNYQLLGMPA